MKVRGNSIDKCCTANVQLFASRRQNSCIPFFCAICFFAIIRKIALLVPPRTMEQRTGTISLLILISPVPPAAAEGSGKGPAADRMMLCKGFHRFLVYPFVIAVSTGRIIKIPRPFFVYCDSFQTVCFPALVIFPEPRAFHFWNFSSSNVIASTQFLCFLPLFPAGILRL